MHGWAKGKRRPVWQEGAEGEKKDFKWVFHNKIFRQSQEFGRDPFSRIRYLGLEFVREWWVNAPSQLHRDSAHAFHGFNWIFRGDLLIYSDDLNGRAAATGPLSLTTRAILRAPSGRTGRVLGGCTDDDDAVDDEVMTDVEWNTVQDGYIVEKKGQMKSKIND